MSSVPQFIDVEDKIAGPLTWRQLLWMIGMVVTLLIIYNAIGTLGFIVTGVPIVLLFSALAFYRPQGQPLISFFFHGITYFFRPKVAVWQRPTGRSKKMATPTVAPKPVQKEKRISPEELSRLARILDSK